MTNGKIIAVRKNLGASAVFLRPNGTKLEYSLDNDAWALAFDFDRIAKRARNPQPSIELLETYETAFNVTANLWSTGGIWGVVPTLENAPLVDSKQVWCNALADHIELFAKALCLRLVNGYEEDYSFIEEVVAGADTALGIYEGLQTVLAGMPEPTDAMAIVFGVVKAAGVVAQYAKADSITEVQARWLNPQRWQDTTCYIMDRLGDDAPTSEHLAGLALSSGYDLGYENSWGEWLTYAFDHEPFLSLLKITGLYRASQLAGVSIGCPCDPTCTVHTPNFMPNISFSGAQPTVFQDKWYSGGNIASGRAGILLYWTAPFPTLVRSIELKYTRLMDGTAATGRYVQINAPYGVIYRQLNSVDYVDHTIFRNVNRQFAQGDQINVRIENLTNPTSITYITSFEVCYG